MAKKSPEELVKDAMATFRHTVTFHPYLMVECDGNGQPVNIRWDFCDTVCENEEVPAELVELVSLWVDDQVDFDKATESMTLHDTLKGGDLVSRTERDDHPK